MAPLRTLRRGLPLLLLLTALASLFPAFIDAGPLHEPRRNHHHVTFNHLAVAKNLAAEHAWLGYYRRTVGDDGQTTYDPYNRFPPLGYFLIKLATLTQSGDLAGEIQAARMLMLAFYGGSAVLAYLSVAALTGRRYVALAAALTAFSSYALLHACDMVATEGSLDLFGTMLALHGIVQYQRSAAARTPACAKPRLAQLLAKAAVALLLGWHVVALLAPFVALGLSAAAASRDWITCRRFAAFGGLILVFGLSVLASNLGREYIALSDVAIWDLPSARSMRERSILGGLHEQWVWFGEDQLHRIGLALVPYLATGLDIGWRGWTVLGALGSAGVIAAAVVALVGRPVPRARSVCLVLVPLATAGLLWAVAMPGTVHTHRSGDWPWDTPHALRWDTYEAMFHVGVPLALFALLSQLPVPAVWRRRRRHATGSAPGRVATVCMATLWLAFSASTLAIGQRHNDPDIELYERALWTDMAAIQQFAADKRVFAAGPIWPSYARRGRPYGRKRFSLVDTVLILRSKHARFAEYVAGPRIPGATPLTPDNEFYFLYAVEEYNRLCEAPPAAGTAGTIVLRRWCENL